MWVSFRVFAQRTEIPQLFEELRQICAQYAVEVPGRRRQWPESIKSRVFRLRFLGFSNHRIAQETGIPVMTLYTWKLPSGEEALKLPAPDTENEPGKFVPVRVVKRRSALPARRSPVKTILTVKTSDSQNFNRKSRTPPTVTVVHPNGIRLEGLTLEQALEAIRKLSR